MRRQPTRFQAQVEELLQRAGVTDAPIPVERVASHLGATIYREPFEGDVSGMLYREDGQPVIGVNSLHSRTRQRFTIAHEIGHLKLHDDKLHIDRGFKVLRNEVSSQGIDPHEVEANAFAAELLMPTAMLVRDFDGRFLDYDQDDLIDEFADRYRVSVQAMTIRLATLGFIDPG